jgi:hypothetical protein
MLNKLKANEARSNKLVKFDFKEITSDKSFSAQALTEAFKSFAPAFDATSSKDLLEAFQRLNTAARLALAQNYPQFQSGNIDVFDAKYTPFAQAHPFLFDYETFLTHCEALQIPEGEIAVTPTTKLIGEFGYLDPHLVEVVHAHSAWPSYLAEKRELTPWTPSVSPHYYIRTSELKASTPRERVMNTSFKTTTRILADSIVRLVNARHQYADAKEILAGLGIPTKYKASMHFNDPRLAERCFEQGAIIAFFKALVMDPLHHEFFLEKDTDRYAILPLYCEAMGVSFTKTMKDKDYNTALQLINNEDGLGLKTDVSPVSINLLDNESHWIELMRNDKDFSIDEFVETITKFMIGNGADPATEGALIAQQDIRFVVHFTETSSGDSIHVDSIDAKVTIRLTIAWRRHIEEGEAYDYLDIIQPEGHNFFRHINSGLMTHSDVQELKECLQRATAGSPKFITEDYNSIIFKLHSATDQEDLMQFRFTIDNNRRTKERMATIGICFDNEAEYQSEPMTEAILALPDEAIKPLDFEQVRGLIALPEETTSDRLRGFDLEEIQRRFGSLSMFSTLITDVIEKNYQRYFIPHADRNAYYWLLRDAWNYFRETCQKLNIPVPTCSIQANNAHVSPTNIRRVNNSEAQRLYVQYVMWKLGVTANRPSAQLSFNVVNKAGASQLPHTELTAKVFELEVSPWDVLTELSEADNVLSREIARLANEHRNIEDLLKALYYRSTKIDGTLD